MDIGAFKKSAQASLFPPEGDLAQQQRFYHALNGMVAAFLLPPSRILLSVVATDFKTSQRITIPEVVGFLFVTTRFYFSHRDVIPQCASLVTFRDKDGDKIFAIFKGHAFSAIRRSSRYRALSGFWVGVLVGFVLNREAPASATLPISVRTLPRCGSRAVHYAHQLPFSGIPAAVYASDVGANDRLTGCPIWEE